MVAAGLGGALARTLSHSPIAMTGMLSFGTSALLFMVAEGRSLFVCFQLDISSKVLSFPTIMCVEELLLDAHEDGEHVWWVDLQLYTGFFASIIAGKFVA